jgi:anti-sigma factor NepR-like protein
MHMDAQARKVGGRLSREDQRRLGDILQRVYDDVLRQGVPDRFKDLLSELEERKERGEDSMLSGNGQGEEARSRDADRLMEAKGFPHNKGSS